MKLIRWITLIVIVSLLSASCGTTGDSADLSEAALPVQDFQAPVTLAGNLAQKLAGEIQPNECLACHADKRMLIETGKPVEEPSESESSGVG